MACSSLQEPVTARLILSTGSNAGTEAPLLIGYYMIGRDGECQIRPKSRSVSRRHCLVHHVGDVVNVFDMDSTAGTFVNENRLSPRQWVRLHDGDTLRMGKVQFQVRIHESPTGHEASDDQAARKEKSSLPSSAIEPGQQDGLPSAVEKMVTGEAWESFDVIDFLEEEDAAAQERRYAEILGEESEATIIDEAEPVSEGSPEPDEEKSTSDSGTSNAVNKKRKKQEKTYAPAKRKKSGGRKRLSLPRFGNLVSGDSQSTLQLIAVVTLVCVALSFAGYKVFQTVSGPEVRIVPELDQ